MNKTSALRTKKRMANLVQTTGQKSVGVCASHPGAKRPTQKGVGWERGVSEPVSVLRDTTQLS
jgi:hypothetical protein